MSAVLKRPIMCVRKRADRWVVFCRACGYAPFTTPSHSRAVDFADRHACRWHSTS